LQFFFETTPIPQAILPRWDGVDELISHLKASDPERVTIHHGHMPEIDFVDDDTPRAYGPCTTG
jgi:hypothetical protein